MRWHDVIRRTARLMVGVPDYQAYLDHHRSACPGREPMSRAEFHRERIERRYARGTSGRCC
jgi:uncharacterized short protein YbdD (DUF466 family)